MARCRLSEREIEPIHATTMYKGGIRVKRMPIAILAVVMGITLLAGTAFAAPIRMQIASSNSDKHNAHIASVEFLKPYIEEHSKGQIVVELFPNGVLGSDRQAIESTMMGTLTATITVVPALATFEPKFQILDLPFIFDNRDEAMEILDGAFGEKLSSFLPARNMINLCFFPSGFRNITNNRGPIEKVADLKNMKIRTMENPIHMATFRALGANPTPVSYGELYTALQQKMVDGQENPIVNIFTIKLQEVQKFCTISNHVYASAILLTNKKWFESLTPELQKVVRDGAALFTREQRKMSLAQEQEMIKAMQKEGMVFNTLTAEQKAPFIEATKGVHGQYAKDVNGGQEMLDALYKARQERTKK